MTEVTLDSAAVSDLVFPREHAPAYRATTTGARVFKRTLDLLVAIPCAIALLLLFPVFALLVRLDSRGPVLFRQQRVGRNGELIGVLKVRTMRIDAEEMLRADPELWAAYVANGYKLPEGKDPRVTRFGAWLRRTSLDEMPQFFCVLSGTMSLVGPRPVLPDELPVLYGELAPDYEAVKPGLTGLWQVSGRSRVTDVARARLDAEYVRSWSPLVELGILARTIPAVILRRGAH